MKHDITLHLAAALRDARSTHDNARNVAVRSLAPAVLEDLGERPPSHAALSRHPEGDAVRQCLLDLCRDDSVPMIRGLAAVALGQLGETTAVDTLEPWLDLDGDGESSVFLRECAVLGLSFIASTCPRELPVYSHLTLRLQRALGSPHADVRFQTAVALAEIGLVNAATLLCEALDRETHAQVRTQIVVGLSLLEHLPEPAITRLSDLAAEDEPTALGFEAALALANAGQLRAPTRLFEGLTRPDERDRALEAIATLPPGLAPAQLAAVRSLASRLFVAPVTRVRAAYALARHAPEEGRARLAKLRRSLRASVREAVADAEQALAELERRTTSDDTVRHESG